MPASLPDAASQPAAQQTPTTTTGSRFRERMMPPFFPGTAETAWRSLCGLVRDRGVQFDERRLVHPDQAAAWAVEVEDDVQDEREDRVGRDPEAEMPPLRLPRRVPQQQARH